MTTTKKTETNELSGKQTGLSRQEFDHLENYKNLEEPISSLKKRWEKPNNIRELAIQAVKVGTMVLNDEIDIDKARAYSAVVKVTTQSISSEVHKARMAGKIPDLDL